MQSAGVTLPLAPETDSQPTLEKSEIVVEKSQVNTLEEFGDWLEEQSSDEEFKIRNEDEGTTNGQEKS